MAPNGLPRRMRPRDIRYTQESIGSRFTDGAYLSDTFEKLLNRRISVDQLEWISVVEERSLYWALTGNRRLYLYRMLEDLGEVDTIPVREFSLFDYGVRRRFDNRNTTTCDGRRIEMRQSEALGYFRSVIKTWKYSKMVKRNRNEGLTTYTMSSHHLRTEMSYGATSVGRNYSHQFNSQNRYEPSPSERRLVACSLVGFLLLLFVMLVLFLLFLMYLVTQ